MNRVFVDTSALYAVLVVNDGNHAQAARVFHGLIRDQSTLITSSYVLVETYALLGRRLGRPAVTAFRGGLAPLLEVAWVDSTLHERALDLLLGHSDRDLSLVDATSFLLIEQERAEGVFAYDRHFAAAGFLVL